MNPLLLLGWQRYAVYGALLSVILGAAWFHGYTRGELKLSEYKAEQATAAVPIIVRQGQGTVRIVTKYKDRVVQLAGETVTIEKEIVRYVPSNADPMLGLGWVRLHDSAAVGAVPGTPQGFDVTAPAVTAAQALRGVITNYGSCHRTELQLAALQEWVRYQYETANQKDLGY